MARNTLPDSPAPWRRAGARGGGLDVRAVASPTGEPPASPARAPGSQRRGAAPAGGERQAAASSGVRARSRTKTRMSSAADLPCHGRWVPGRVQPAKSLEMEGQAFWCPDAPSEAFDRERPLHRARLLDPPRGSLPALRRHPRGAHGRRLGAATSTSARRSSGGEVVASVSSADLTARYGPAPDLRRPAGEAAGHHGRTETEAEWTHGSTASSSRRKVLRIPTSTGRACRPSRPPQSRCERNLQRYAVRHRPTRDDGPLEDRRGPRARPTSTGSSRVRSGPPPARPAPWADGGRGVRASRPAAGRSAEGRERRGSSPGAPQRREAQAASSSGRSH